MSHGEYLAGVAFLLATVGAIAGAAALLASRVGPRDRLLRFLTFTLLSTAGLTFVPLTAGALGLFRREWALIIALLVLGGAFWWSRRLPTRETEPGKSTPVPDRLAPDGVEPRRTRILGLVLLGVLLVGAMAYLRDVALVATRMSDMTTFHLPVIARWLQADSIWGLHQFVPLRPEETYPQNGDIVIAGVMLPFESDFLVRPLGVAFLTLTGVAVYALARELGGTRAAARLMTCVLISIPALFLIAFEGMPDPIMLSALATGVLFLVRHSRTAARTDLVLAGLGLGLAFGAKWWAASTVVVIVLVWAGAHALARRPARVLLGQGALLVAVIAAAGGFWLVRNLVETGNPVFPLKVAPLGVTIFDAPPDPGREEFGSTLVDYLGDWDVWRERLWPDFGKTMGLSALLLAACGALAGAFALRGRRIRALPLALAVAAGLIALVYFNTPYSGLGPQGDPLLAAINGRWTMGALIMCAALAAWLHGGLMRTALALEIVAVFAFFDTFDYIRNVREDSVLIALVVLALLAVAAQLARRKQLGPEAVAGVTVAGALLLVAVGDEAQQRFHDRRYADVDPVLTYIRDRAPQGNRIGIAGEAAEVSPVLLAAFGPRLENRVEYVGPFRRHLLHFYEDRESFTGALRRGRYDLLLVEHGLRRKNLASDQQHWAEDEGWRPVAESTRSTLYRPGRALLGPRATAASAVRRAGARGRAGESPRTRLR